MRPVAPASKRRRRSRPATTVVIVLAAVVASALWWGATRRVVAPGAPGQDGPNPARPEVAAGAPTALRAQAATGGAIAGQWAPASSGPPATSYQVAVVPAGGGPSVASAVAWSPSAVVGGLTVGRRYQLVVKASGRWAAATSAPVLVVVDRPPDPPSQVTLTQMSGTNGLRADWDLAASGVAATGAVVQLYDGLAYQGYVTCQVACTTAAFRGLAYGRQYRVRVVPTNDAGQGPAAASNPVDLRSPCPAAAACVAIDATSVVGPARQRAQGFLNSFYPGGNLMALARALKPRSWRGAPGYQPATGTLDWSSWDAATSTGAQATLVLSNLWQAETVTSAGGARTPWSGWGAYASWVTDTVREVEASGRVVSFWEIQNEPGAPGYFSASDWAASTVADYLQQFQVAYRAIKAADPAAQIIGPSLSHFADYPGEYDPHAPDLVTFLDFAASHGLRLAAISWHEIDDTLGPQPRDFNNLPEIIEDHVAEARRLIAERPALGRPQVWVNEYGRPSDYAIPGWALGDIVALEHASVDRAGRSCWPELAVGVTTSGTYDDCSAPTLDGLLEPAGPGRPQRPVPGSTPRAAYWVYATYARMTGDLVAAASSDATVAVLAARDDSAGRVVAMVGRDVGCPPVVDQNCSGPAALTVPTIAVGVTVHVPWKVPTVEVTIAAVQPSLGPLLVPPTIFHGPVPVTRATASLSLPAVADGAVDLITIGR